MQNDPFDLTQLDVFGTLLMILAKVYTFGRILKREAIVKTATAKDLRQKTAALLDEVRRGHHVIITYRGKSIAVLAPVERAERKGLHPAGFGIWQGRKDMPNVEQWLSNLRQPRHTR